MRLIVIAAVSTVVLVSCTTAEVEPPGLIGDWEMTGGTIDGAPFPMVDGHRITISFTADGEVGGVAACNSFGGSYVADAEDVIIGDEISSSAMACGPDVVMESERAFLAALRPGGSLTYERSGSDLTIEGAGAVMEFTVVTPVPEADLVGTEWTLETLVSGDVAQSAAGDPATLLLSEGGRVAASTGCRSLSGDFVIDGDTVLFATFGAEGTCPAGLVDQDNRVVSVLGDGFTVDIEGDRLTLTSRGNEGLVYRRPGVEELDD